MSRRRIAQRLHRASLLRSSAKRQSKPPSKSLILTMTSLLTKAVKPRVAIAA